MVGASARETIPLRPHRGTDPYSAKVIASMTVDFPDPVGPTRAKKSASAKSTWVGSRKEAKPFMSSTTGRMAGSFLAQPALPAAVTSSCSCPNSVATRASCTCSEAQ